jgi:hypothetical protein
MRTTHTRPIVFAVVLVVAVAVVSIAAAATSGWRVIGKASASGQFAVAAASGSAKRPHAIAVRITGGGGGVAGFGVVACSRGIGSIGSTSTNFKGHFGTLKLPMTNSDSCQVTASASGSGKLKLEILAR